MRISELINMQDEFEKPRGLDIVNTPSVAFLKLMEESAELWQELVDENWEDALVEAADNVILIGSVVLGLLEKTGKTPEEFEDIVRRKFNQNFEKYDEQFFNNGWTTQQAMTLARHWWNMGLNEGSWHEEEDF